MIALYANRLTPNMSVFIFNLNIEWDHVIILITYSAILIKPSRAALRPQRLFETLTVDLYVPHTVDQLPSYILYSSLQYAASFLSSELLERARGVKASPRLRNQFGIYVRAFHVPGLQNYA